MTGKAAILAAQNFNFPKSRLVLGRGMGYNVRNDTPTKAVSARREDGRVHAFP